MRKFWKAAGIAAVATAGFLSLSVATATPTRADAASLDEIIAQIPAYESKAGIAGNINIVGSDTLLNLDTLWSEDFRKLYPSVKFSIEGKGSSTAPPALISGTADLGPMSRAMKDQEIADFEAKFGYKPSVVKVAIDALAVFVHKDNPVKELGLDEVDAIFSSTRKGGYPADITTWGQVGLGGNFASSAITMYGRNSASGTYGYFKEKALFKGDYKDAVKQQPGSSAVVQSVSEDRFSIGYSGIGYKTAGVKTVPLSKQSGSISYDATPDNCYNGKYPLSRFLYIYFNKAPGKQVAPHVQEFLTFVLSREGQSIVRKDGYIPMTTALCNKELEVLGVSRGGSDGPFKKILDEIPAYESKAGIAGNISIVGSDTLLNLDTLWSEDFRKLYPSVKFSIEGKGSSTAPPALISGTSDLGPMSRKMKDKEIADFEAKFGYKPSMIAVSIDALAVFAHKDNPVKELSMQQVDAIFSSTRKGGFPNDITTWGQAGLDGGFASAGITMYGRNSASGTYAYFKEHALFKGDYKDGVKQQPGSSAVVQSVSEDRFGIGYSGIGYKTAGVKTVPLSKAAGEASYDATPENCYNGKYPLSRFLYIYFNKAPGKELAPHVREFLTFVLSREGQAIVAKDGYIPLTSSLCSRNLQEVK